LRLPDIGSFNTKSIDGFLIARPFVKLEGSILLPQTFA
jgi:hypothetical protein